MSVDRLSVTVPSEVGTALRDLASARGTTVSNVVAEAISHAIRMAAMDTALAEADRRFGAVAEDQVLRAEAEAEPERTEGPGRPTTAPAENMSRLILDAGAFNAFERGDTGIRARLAAARRLGFALVTSAPVVGQVWRDGRRQALVARLLDATDVTAPDLAAARRAGVALARTDGQDVVDALLVGLARDGDTVVTSDPDDIERLLAASGVRAMVASV